MYLATRDLLLAWKERKGCQFDIASKRPGRGKNNAQPLFGTQRVWMSSQQLYGNRYGCGVQQVIPMQWFGALTVHHLPNKNYRRVGKYRTRDTTPDEGVAVSDEKLLTAMQLHLALVEAFPPQARPREEIRVRMWVDEDNPAHKVEPESWKVRLKDFQAYLGRGGVLSPQDMTQTSLY
jgi:hypothetical protein